MTKPVLRGMATVSYWADDVTAARDWYTDLLGIEAYFQRPDADNPAYVEFRIGDQEAELGIISRAFAPEGTQPGPGGAVLYWHVDDVAAVHEKLLAAGATSHEPITKREAGFITASVLDPFGNILGIMRNLHYVEMLGR